MLERWDDDGQVVRPKGSLRMLDEWLAPKFEPKDSGPITEMIATLKRIRKLGQNRASLERKSLNHNGGILVSRIFASWNQLDAWLRQVEGLREAA